MSIEAPKISVIIPLYNAEDYIRITLLSLKNQTFQDFEVVIVNDCSTDNSLEVVKEIQEKNKIIGDKIRIIELERNGGISNTRNVGLSFANGEYVTFLDNDDMLIPQALETFIKIAEEWNAEVVHTHSHYQNPKDMPQGNKMTFRMASFEHGNKVNLKSPPYLLTNDMSERMYNFSIYGIDWNVWGKLFRRDFLMKNSIQFPKIKLTEDLLFVFQTLLYAKKYVMIPDALYVYRYRLDSTLHGERDKNFLRKVIDVQINGTKMLNDYMDGIEHFKDHFKDREHVINFYMNLELLGTKLMQRKYGEEEDYFEMLQEIYTQYFGKDATFVAFIHKIANQRQPATSPPWPTENTGSTLPANSDGKK